LGRDLDQLARRSTRRPPAIVPRAMRVPDVLPEARAGDVDADGVHREAVEDRGGQGGVAEVAAPLAERDVRGDRGAAVGSSPRRLTCPTLSIRSA
jgi:hypothetical protein